MEYHTRLHSCKKEPETIAWIENEFRPGDVFYDIGANVGAYTLVAATYWREAVRVVAIEPAALNFSRLLRNLSLNGTLAQVIPLPIALGEKTGIFPFHYQNLTAGGSLHALGEQKDYRGESFQPAASFPTLAYDLDTLIDQFQLPPPTHLKLDVDGTELNILQGARRTLSSVRSLLVELEAHHPQASQVRRLMAESGFEETSSHPYRYGKQHPEFEGVSNVIFHRIRTLAHV